MKQEPWVKAASGFSMVETGEDERHIQGEGLGLVCTSFSSRLKLMTVIRDPSPGS